MRYIIVDESQNDLVLFETTDKFEAERALCRLLYLGHDAYLVTQNETKIVN